MGYIDKFSIGGTEYDLADTSTIENICTDVEDGSVASKTYNAGKYILRNGQLYRVTTTIASGSAITEGVNIESATVGGELTNIQNVINTKGKRPFNAPSQAGLYAQTIYDNNFVAGNWYIYFCTVGTNTVKYDAILCETDGEVRIGAETGAPFTNKYILFIPMTE